MNFVIDYKAIEDEFNEGLNQIKLAVKRDMQYIGETYTAVAKENGNYKDQTGNLRAANGYGIIENCIVTEADAGRSETVSGIQQESSKSADMELIVGNGMEYCSFVEARGYDVVSTGFLEAEKLAKGLLSK